MGGGGGMSLCVFKIIKPRVEVGENTAVSDRLEGLNIYIYIFF